MKDPYNVIAICFQANNFKMDFVYIKTSKQNANDRNGICSRTVVSPINVLFVMLAMNVSSNIGILIPLMLLNTHT